VSSRSRIRQHTYDHVQWGHNILHEGISVTSVKAPHSQSGLATLDCTSGVRGGDISAVYLSKMSVND